MGKLYFGVTACTGESSARFRVGSDPVERAPWGAAFTESNHVSQADEVLVKRRIRLGVCIRCGAQHGRRAVAA